MSVTVQKPSRNLTSATDIDYFGTADEVCVRGTKIAVLVEGIFK